MIYFYVFKVGIFKNGKFIDYKNYLVSFCNIYKFMQFINDSDKVVQFIQPYNSHINYYNFDKINFS